METVVASPSLCPSDLTGYPLFLDPSLPAQPFAGWLLLNLVTVLWGTQHAIIKLALDDPTSNTSPSQLNLARFLIAGATALRLLRLRTPVDTDCCC
jgi:hypothetical protein